ncbi:MAG: hypothetical protein J6V63_04590 [Spirochaetaceae bacterium]|nr:hypothetical protein [Spirochaetaceae bacterium]
MFLLFYHHFTHCQIIHGKAVGFNCCADLTKEQTMKYTELIGILYANER